MHHGLELVLEDPKLTDRIYGDQRMSKAAIRGFVKLRRQLIDKIGDAIYRSIKVWDAGRLPVDQQTSSNSSISGQSDYNSVRGNDL